MSSSSRYLWLRIYEESLICFPGVSHYIVGLLHKRTEHSHFSSLHASRTKTMSHLLNPLRTTTRSVAILFLSRSTQHVVSRSKTSNCFHYGHSYTINSQPQHIATWPSHWCRRYSTTPENRSDPLHILFCGSDDLSCASLKALHDEYIKNPYLIQSIDVVVRPGKPMGRGYKTIHDRESTISSGFQISTIIVVELIP